MLGCGGRVRVLCFVQLAPPQVPQPPPRRCGAVCCQTEFTIQARGSRSKRRRRRRKLERLRVFHLMCAVVKNFSSHPLTSISWYAQESTYTSKSVHSRRQVKALHTLSWGCFFFDHVSHSLMIFPQRTQRSSSAFSWKLMLPEVIEICDVSEDLLEWPLWQERELSDLASVSINLQSLKTLYLSLIY